MWFRKALSISLLVSGCVATGDNASDPAPDDTARPTSTLQSALCSSYGVTDLGLPTASGGGQATAIDDAGNVAGTYQPTTVAISHAFRWNGSGSLVDLGTLGGGSAFAHGISGARVAGESPLASGDDHAFLADATGIHDLGTLGGGGIDASQAYSVNASGVAVGKSRLANGFQHAARYQSGTATDLGTIVGTLTSNSAALAINAGGVIVGASDTATGSHAARWSGATITDLGSVGTDDSVANAVNASGVAAGNILHSFAPRPARFSGGTVTQITIPTGFETASANGINNDGLIVGTMTHAGSGEAPGTIHGFIYDGTSAVDLNSLVAGSGWQITAASAINTSGQIAATAVSTATGMGADHRQHAVVLTPGCASASPAFRSIATQTNGTTVARPAGVIAGDFLLAALEFDADPRSITPPAGWTLVVDQRAAAGTASVFHAVVYSHVAGASEPASYTFAAPAGVFVDVQLAAYLGITAIDTFASTAATSASTIAAPSVTTSAINELLVTIYIDFAGGSWSVAPGMTQRSNFDSNSLQDERRLFAGATGTRSASNATGAMAAISIALK